MQCKYFYKSCNPCEQPGSGGFTFIEVLVSIAVLTTIAIAFLPLFAGSINMLDRAGEMGGEMLDEMGDMDARLGEGRFFRGGTVPVKFDGRDLVEIPGGVYVSQAEKITAFVSFQQAYMTLAPDSFIEGYAPPKDIDITGVNTNFASGSSSLHILNKDGDLVNTSYYSNISVSGSDEASFRLWGGLTNAAGLYTVRVTTTIDDADEVVRALLRIMLPKYVAVGSGGAMIVSDGEFFETGKMNWESRTSGVADHINSITWGDTGDYRKYLAVGNSGLVLHSTSGVDWNIIDWDSFPGLDVNEHLNGILFADLEDERLYVVVGNSGTVLTSTDGLVWRKETSGTGGDLNDVAVGIKQNGFDVNRLLIAVGDGGLILSSNDGVAWTEKLPPDNPSSPDPDDPDPLTENLNGVTWGVAGDPAAPEDASSLFVAVGDDGVIISSEDGAQWETQRLPDPLADNLNRAAFGTPEGNPLFVVVGDNGTILTSIDGSEWTPMTSGIGNNLNGVVWDKGSGHFFAIGDGGRLLASSNGISWILNTTPGTGSLNSLTVQGGTGTL